MLAYELFLQNRDNDAEAVKSVVPIKKIFVKTTDVVTVQLDSGTLEHYGETLNLKDPKVFFQEPLSMPSNNLSSVGLPNRATGANSKKPYVEIYGNYGKNKLTLSIAGEGNGQKETFDYEYNFESGKETVATPVDLLFLRLDAKNYFIGNKLLFDAYREDSVITSQGALSSTVFIAVCRGFFSFWKERIVFEDLNKFSRFTFRIVVLPYSGDTQGKVVYQSQEEASTGEVFEDCFGNNATDYPSKPTINVKFVSFDDEAFTINCKTGKEFYQTLGIGNESFAKINLPTERVIRIAGLEWYFFDLQKPSTEFEAKGSGIYSQLLSNYNVLSSGSEASKQRESSLKVICTKRAQAKLEVLLDENLTLDQLKKMLDGAQDNSKSRSALELLIVETARDTIWTDYIAAVRHFMNGSYFERTVLVQRFTNILRGGLWNWIKSNKPIKKETDDFFGKSQFCLDLLTRNESELMNKNEEYAYKIGVIAGKYVKFKREKNETNNSTKDILTYSKYDRERLRFVYQRVSIGVALSKVDTDVINQSIKNDLPKEEIADTHAYEDYSYFFYKGVFENLT